MSEKEYLAQDQELMAIFARKKAGSVELSPAVEVRILPADRAEEVCALDERIQTVKQAAPMLLAGGVGLLGLIAASAGWMHWALAVAVFAAFLVNGLGKFRRA